MRVLFFGMRGAFSLPTLQALLASDHALLGVVVPAEGPPPRPAFWPAPSPSSVDFNLYAQTDTPQDVTVLAAEQGIPVYHLAKPKDAGFLQWLAELAPDVACVACFNHIFPPAMLTIPRHGVLNVHPSLLPHYRGPEPLFWQFRDGLKTVGVTIHWMDAGADTGPIADQMPVPLAEDGTEIDGLRAEVRCAQVGAALLVSCLDRLAVGKLSPTPQPSGGSAQPMPTIDDFTLPRTWRAEQAAHFVRGTAHWGIPYTVDVDGGTIQIQDVLGWEATKMETVEEIGRRIKIPFEEGTLIGLKGVSNG